MQYCIEDKKMRIAIPCHGIKSRGYYPSIPSLSCEEFVCISDITLNLIRHLTSLKDIFLTDLFLTLSISVTIICALISNRAVSYGPW